MPAHTLEKTLDASPDLRPAILHTQPDDADDLADRWRKFAKQQSPSTITWIPLDVEDVPSLSLPESLSPRTDSEAESPWLPISRKCSLSEIEEPHDDNSDLQFPKVDYSLLNSFKNKPNKSLIELCAEELPPDILYLNFATEAPSSQSTRSSPS